LVERQLQKAVVTQPALARGIGLSTRWTANLLEQSLEGIGGEHGSVPRGRGQTVQSEFDLRGADATEVGDFPALHPFREPRPASYCRDTSRYLKLGLHNSLGAHHRPQLHQIATRRVGNLDDDTRPRDLTDVAWLMKVVEDFFRVHEKQNDECGMMNDELRKYPSLGIESSAARVHHSAFGIHHSSFIIL
jgi:hypothetical protein